MNCLQDNEHVGELQEIYRHIQSDLEEVVVRWYPACGAVVVDGESDGRIYPGRVKKMMFPSWHNQGKDLV